MMFQDRTEAGRRLAEALSDLRDADPVVLALPRGGVPVGAEIARALGCPLDIVLVRKIGAPGQPELALGAVVDGPTPECVLNDDIIALTGASPAHIARTEVHEITEMERRRALYRGDREPVPAAGRTAILVDDGVATGATMKAAIVGVRRAGPARLVVAVPVGAPETVAALETLADAVHCLHVPPALHAIGLYYRDFSQVDDDTVIALLQAAGAASA